MSERRHGAQKDSIALIVASALIGLGLVAFLVGYQIGRDMGRAFWAPQNIVLSGKAR
ncbi:MAG: hypothetical protein H2054_02965 [Sphingomonas sp.]|uniref:hypothetical protein n=1 Tax=Sphingomonas sp. TaxID=28214 RepID=UPI0017B86131|nr:hypothetical protein [Sphingomonas sp.]